MGDFWLLIGFWDAGVALKEEADRHKLVYMI